MAQDASDFKNSQDPTVDQFFYYQTIQANIRSSGEGDGRMGTITYQLVIKKNDISGIANNNTIKDDVMEESGEAENKSRFASIIVKFRRWDAGLAEFGEVVAETPQNEFKIERVFASPDAAPEDFNLIKGNKVIKVKWPEPQSVVYTKSSIQKSLVN